MDQKGKIMIIRKLVLPLLLIGVVSCGEISKDDYDCIVEGRCNNQPDATPTVPVSSIPSIRTPTPSVPKITPTPQVGSGVNPFCVAEADSRNHLLWKPVSDNSPNSVVVIDGKYKREFLTVKAELKDGSFETLFYKPLILLGNPDRDGPRQHWRSRNRASAFKDKALILADDGYQVCKFRLPGSPLKRWE